MAPRNVISRHGYMIMIPFCRSLVTGKARPLRWNVPVSQPESCAEMRPVCSDYVSLTFRTDEEVPPEYRRFALS